jgi:hypothetical protein
MYGIDMLMMPLIYVELQRMQLMELNDQNIYVGKRKIKILK